MDQHVPKAITIGLRVRGVDVMTAEEDDRRDASDAELMDRATALGRIFISSDVDTLVIAAERQRRGESFSGLIYAHPLRVSVGQCIRDIELIAKAASPDEFRDTIEYLPLT